ncbi:MAG: hypothetical protein AAF799_28680 [Myxococcota bacterium]
MSDASPARPSLWPTRLLWAGLGSVVTLLVMRAMTEPGPAEESSPSPTAAAEPNAAPVAGTEPLLAPPPPATTPAEGSGTTTSANATPEKGSDSTTGEPDLTSSGTATSDEVDLSGLPEIPLPRMPGTRFMQRFREPTDDETGWIIRLTLSVPASGSQVETFYRTALRDEGLKVWGGGPAGASIADGYRGTLRGRAHHANAEVIIRQRAGRLSSVVRIIWTTHD